MKIKLFGFLMAIVLSGSISIYSSLHAQTMTCTLIPGSATYDPTTGFHCALYNCPNGEQVQSCHVHGGDQ